MVTAKDRRRFTRYKNKSGFCLSIAGNSFQAATVDFSLGGIGFFVEETPFLLPLPVSAINLNIENLSLDINGKVVWSQKENSRLRVGVERESIYGLLKHYLLSDILLDLQRSEKKGILEVRNGPISKKIYIKNGNMVFATSNREEDRLGEFLVRTGKISADQYHQSVDILKKTGKRQGTILVELGYLKPEDLIWAVRHQVEEIIMNLFLWENGEFVFLEGPLFSKEVITLKISAANLIYRGIKKIINSNHIKNAMPPVDTILCYSADPLNLFQNINLDKIDKDILFFIDGRRTIKEILSISPIDNLETMKTLYSLLCARIIESEGKRLIGDKIHEEIIKEHTAGIDSSFIEKTEDLYQKCGYKDYYGILEIEKWVAQDKIKKAYYKCAKEFHPDKHFSFPSETLKNKLNTIFTHITEAYRILSDPKMRKEYDQSLSIRPAKIESNNAEIARVRFREGKNAFGKKSYAEAAELFGQAAYLNNLVPDYHFHMGLALMKVKRLHEAEQAIIKALAIDPFNADYMAELGHVYLQLGFSLRAKKTFENALKIHPSHVRITEGLQKL